jgi:tRNASer (uridine44-2'-O)-methyltransferase
MPFDIQLISANSPQDIGIATFLMLFWKDMLATSSVKELDGSPWKSWPRPSGGFLDLG